MSSQNHVWRIFTVQWMAIGVRGLVGRHVQNLVTEARVDGSGAVTILLLLMVVKIVREEQNEYKHVMKTNVQLMVTGDLGHDFQHAVLHVDLVR